jgi:hypothetical protein
MIFTYIFISFYRYKGKKVIKYQIDNIIWGITVKKIKTSLSLNETLWKEFSIAVLQKEGNRKLSEVIENLIRQYVKGNKRG